MSETLVIRLQKNSFSMSLQAHPLEGSPVNDAPANKWMFYAIYLCNMKVLTVSENLKQRPIYNHIPSCIHQIGMYDKHYNLINCLIFSSR